MVSREVKRNSTPRGYNVVVAKKFTIARAKKTNKRKLDKDLELRAIENLNGLIREYFLRDMDMSTVIPEYKKLNFLTPNEALANYLRGSKSDALNP